MLSIVQDPLPVFNLAEDAPAHALRPSMSFAQPIVFFSLDPITNLAKSPVARYVKHLRFRIPLRTVWNKICERNAFPSVEILDLSTSPVHREQAAAAILNGFPRLRHLLVDASGFGGLGPEQNEWRTLGRAMAMAGIKNAREKERELKNLDATEVHRILDNAGRRDEFADRGDNELSGTALEDEGRKEHPVPKTDRPARTLQLAKFRILPAYPHLLSISSALAPNQAEEGVPVDLELYAEQFSAGWTDGIARLREHRERAMAFSRSANVRVLRFDLHRNCDHEDSHGLGELVDVEEHGVDDLTADGSHTTPLICFGRERNPSQPGSNPALVPVHVPHKPGCGHALGRERWMPELHTVPAEPGLL
ncbi:hypothetical protein FRC04_007498 [Tulasnella sp. 424]|nr:hypothetical protein FRC04_007498 [Tulasnella sp. 424]